MISNRLENDELASIRRTEESARENTVEFLRNSSGTLEGGGRGWGGIGPVIPNWESFSSC